VSLAGPSELSRRTVDASSVGDSVRELARNADITFAHPSNAGKLA
jgi:hypothetical protein